MRKTLTGYLASDTESQCWWLCQEARSSHWFFALVFYRTVKGDSLTAKLRHGDWLPRHCYVATGPNSDFHPVKARTQRKAKLCLQSALVGLALESVSAYCLSCWCPSTISMLQRSQGLNGWTPLVIRKAGYCSLEGCDCSNTRGVIKKDQRNIILLCQPGRGRPFSSELVLFVTSGHPEKGQQNTVPPWLQSWWGSDLCLKYNADFFELNTKENSKMSHFWQLCPWCSAGKGLHFLLVTPILFTPSSAGASIHLAVETPVDTQKIWLGENRDSKPFLRSY